MALVFQLLRSVAALLVVLWLANRALKYLNKYSSDKTRAIQIVERISVSKTSSLALVKVVDNYYLMSFSENASEVLQKLSRAEVEKIEAQQKETQTLTKPFESTDLKEQYGKLFNRFR